MSPSKKPNPRARYLIKLSAPLDTAASIQAALHLPALPQLLRDDNDPSIRFISVDTATRDAYLAHLAPFVSFYISLRIPADKDLSPISLAPTLGIDATLPHYRCDTAPQPLQDDYPIPYFFYSTLAEPERLAQMLGLNQTPVLKKVIVRRGEIKLWGGKYRALVNGCENDEVRGSMYVVEGKEHEDVLRDYEGGTYEAVRCEIGFDSGEVVTGLTFRFCGDVEELE
jgi:hypothetical protein